MRRKSHAIRGIVHATILASALVIAGACSSARAAEIKLLSIPGMMSVIQELGPKFEASSGHKLAVSYEVNGPMMRRIDAGEKFDAIITLPPDFDQLVSREKLIADSRLGLGRVGIAVWIHAGAPRPDITTVDAFKHVMIEATSVSYTKESGAGMYVAGLMQRLGIADEMRAKTRLLGGGGQNPRAVAAGEVQYGLSIVTDGMDVPGVEMLGLLPHDIEKWFVVVGGLAVNADDPAAARAFFSFLRSPENAPVLKRKGWEPAGQ